MKPFTRSVSPWSIELLRNSRTTDRARGACIGELLCCRAARNAACALRLAVAALTLASGPLLAQLPEGPGRGQTQKLCSDCHELERSISLRQDRDGWKATLNKMISLGAQGTEEEFSAALEYLSRNYPAQSLPPLDVNKAKAIDFETRLSLRRSEAAAVIDYRVKHGNFQSIDDLKRVPGVDPAKFARKKDVLVF
jgi:competence protein ComEA